MWHRDDKIHEDCVQQIKQVYQQDDDTIRYKTALRSIASGLAILPPDARRTEWVSTVAMAALYPEQFIEMEYEEDE